MKSGVEGNIGGGAWYAQTLDLLAPEVVRDPYPFVGRVREEHGACWNEYHRAWLVTRYDDVSVAFRDPRLSSDRLSPYLPDGDGESPMRALSGWMVFKDPPDHTRLRRLVSKAFTPRVVERLRGQILQTVDELIDGLEDRGQADMVGDFAFPLPAIVIAEMLGVPSEDRDLFKAWSEDVLVLVFGAKGEADRHERARRGLGELADYFRALISRYERHPEENLMSKLVRAREGDDGLTEDELVATCTLLLFGGHETTTNLIGSGLLALLRNPEELRRLREDPSLVPSAVEEFLRYDGPSKVAVRFTVEDYQVGDEVMRAGERVFLVQAAANRDPRRFDDPDRLDIGRRNNKHVGFGFGIHYCLGAPLARLEAQIAFAAMLERFQKLELASEDLKWHETILSRGLKELPVSVE